MKFSVVGPKARLLEKLLLESGFVADSIKPEIVFTYGGDGTILLAERKYPGIPKATIKHSQFCYKCVFKEDDLDKILGCLKNRKYGLKEYAKIQAKSKSKTLVSLNEIQMHNKKPTKAVRFSVYVDGRPLFENVVGDGVVIATPYGSTAYYKSVGGAPFEKGIGIALNNPHTPKEPVVVNSESTVQLILLREEAQVFSDNDDKNVLVLGPGDKITIKKHKKSARFIVWDF